MEDLKELRYELGKAVAAFSSICCNFEVLLSHDSEGLSHLLNLVNDDLQSICDDLDRTVKGVCCIRSAAFSALNPPLAWEELHNRRKELGGSEKITALPFNAEGENRCNSSP